jgi:hypothetical protein
MAEDADSAGRSPGPRCTRFGSRSERGLWYGSERLPTAFAEVAYYRILVLEGTAAPLIAFARVPTIAGHDCCRARPSAV